MILPLMSSKKMYLLFMQFKRHEKVLNSFALSINIKIEENNANKINESFK